MKRLHKVEYCIAKFLDQLPEERWGKAMKAGSWPRLYNASPINLVHLICRLVRAPLVDRQIPEQAKALGLSEGHRRRRVHHCRGRRRGHAIFRRVRIERAERPVDGREPRVVHAVT